jgi:hypothetical protein
MIKIKPPQRWVHSIEHGAAVFLYDPCANKTEIEALKNIARKCLRRHIITPYKNLPFGRLFAIVTFGCRLELGSSVISQQNQIKEYLKVFTFSYLKDSLEMVNAQFRLKLCRNTL